MARQPAASCTIELSTGSFIHVAHTPEFVKDERAMSLRSDYNLLRLERQQGAGARFEHVDVDPMAIVAIYPVHERPEKAPIEAVFKVGNDVRSLKAIAIEIGRALRYGQ
jgi:hypothetical protein